MTPDRSRKTAQLSALVLFGFALAVGASRVGAAERIYSAYFSPAPGGSSVIWVAKEARLFDKYGLDVAPVLIPSSVRTLQAILAGESVLPRALAPPLSALVSPAAISSRSPEASTF